MPSVSLTPLGNADHEEYSLFLQEMEDSLIYYSLRFKSFLEDLLECKGDYWIARESGRLTGILPLMWKDGPAGSVLNSLPFYGTNGGALATTSDSEIALSRKFNELAGNAAAATWIPHPLRMANEDHIEFDFTDERIAQFTPLDTQGDPAATLLARIDGAARRNIRKAESCGTRVVVDNHRLDFLEEVHRENMLQIGGKPKSPEFFAEVPKHLEAGQDFKLYVAERAGKMTAALLLLYFNRTVEYYVPTVVEAERVNQPTALLLREAMVDAANAGYRMWNWGGTWLSQTGVWRFKQKWGAQDRQYRYLVRLNAKSILKMTRAELLAGYPDFFVIPFNRLHNEQSCA